jgi:serine/threonine protein kinase
VKISFLTYLDLEIETFSIILELMPLGTLGGAISKNSLESWVTRRQILLDICEGMAFLHASVYADGKEKSVVLHQDIKSANVLLGMEDGKLRAKIADFGLAFLKPFTLDMSASVRHNGGTRAYRKVFKGIILTIIIPEM